MYYSIIVVNDSKVRSLLFEDAERAGMAAVENDVRDIDASG